MEFWLNEDYIPKDCKKCKHLWMCGGRCRIDAVTINGNISLLDPLADLENIDRNFIKDGTSNFIDENIKLLISNEIVCIKEKPCYKISYKKRFMFISKPFAQFMIDHRVLHQKKYPCILICLGSRLLR